VVSGAGIIIGVSDTGLDMNHCLFFDPFYSTPYDTLNLNHQKVKSFSLYFYLA
jgi:hypothetical protein